VNYSKNKKIKKVTKTKIRMIDSHIEFNRSLHNIYYWCDNLILFQVILLPRLSRDYIMYHKSFFFRLRRHPYPVTPSTHVLIDTHHHTCITCNCVYYAQCVLVYCIRIICDWNKLNESKSISFLATVLFYCTHSM